MTTSSDNGYCVYVHKRTDNNDIIYVGEGRARRARLTCKSKVRNKGYAGILKETSVYYEIVQENLTKEEALLLEQKLIDTYVGQGLPITNKLKASRLAKPILRETFFDMFYVDATSPSGLRWKVDRPAKGSGNSVPYNKGDIAGHIGEKSGYWAVKGKPCHRIIYALVHGVCPAVLTVDHIDGNKLNNSVENLQLLSVSENVIKSHNSARKYPTGEDAVNARLKTHQIREIYALFKAFKTDREISDIFKLSYKYVAEIRNGTKWSELFINNNEKFPTLAEVKLRRKPEAELFLS
jgi:hypothetical protein